MVSTLDFESSDPSSNLGRTSHNLTPWRNGSASDSRSEGCVFESRRGQKLFWDKMDSIERPLQNVHFSSTFWIKPHPALIHSAQWMIWDASIKSGRSSLHNHFFTASIYIFLLRRNVNWLTSEHLDYPSPPHPPPPHIGSRVCLWMIRFSLPVDLCKTKYAWLNGYSAWQMLKLSLTAIHCKLNLPGYSV